MARKVAAPIKKKVGATVVDSKGGTSGVTDQKSMVVKSATARQAERVIGAIKEAREIHAGGQPGKTFDELFEEL